MNPRNHHKPKASINIGIISNIGMNELLESKFLRKKRNEKKPTKMNNDDERTCTLFN